MTSQPSPLTPDRAALVDHAAEWLLRRPQSPTPIPDVIAEFEMTVAEGCAAARRAHEMRVCRAAFA